MTRPRRGRGSLIRRSSSSPGTVTTDTFASPNDQEVPVIFVPTAWQIPRQYLAECQEIDSASLLAVYAIGSLGGGYYRPGQSDIDAVLLVKDGSEHIWGTPIAPSEALADINRRYLETYHIPKDFGPFPI